MRDLLIGTGFYSPASQQESRLEFLRLWLRNTIPANIVIVDNSDIGLAADASLRIIRVDKNLGHALAPRIPGRLCGWSLSWILPALVAYSENCDFIYKEQDCLAFGDWIPRLRRARASFGSNSMQACEQSLIYLERDFIPDFIAAYVAIPESDTTCFCETKFAMLEAMFPDSIRRHDLPGGILRPLPIGHPGPWYAQKIVPENLDDLRRAGLV
jgi:hypothetical protein